MGYIFEALERAGDDRDKHQAPQPEADTPTPSAALAHTPHAAQPAAPNDTANPTRSGAERPVHARTIQLEPERIQQLDDRLISLLQPGSRVAEEYRAIRTSLLARWQHARQLVHTITSATPEEGKTITSLNLGLSFAELRNRRTVVVEADLRMPTFATLLGEKNDDQPGLLSYLQEQVQLEQITLQLGEQGLCIIPAGGQANEQAVQLLSSKRMSDLLDHLRQQFDHVIIDTPPVLEFADAGILGALSDEVLLVARMAWTPGPLMREAIQTLTNYNAKVAGLIATDHRRNRGHSSSRYGYRYGYYRQQRRR